MIRRLFGFTLVVAVVLVVAGLTPRAALNAQGRTPAPARKAGEGLGPFKRLVIRGVTIIDGTGAPEGARGRRRDGGRTEAGAMIHPG